MYDFCATCAAKLLVNASTVCVCVHAPSLLILQVSHKTKSCSEFPRTRKDFWATSESGSSKVFSNLNEDSMEKCSFKHVTLKNIMNGWNSQHEKL